jgi:hypothetical protein
VRRLTGLSAEDMAVRVERDPRFLVSNRHPGLLLARLAFLQQDLGAAELRRINLSALAGMPVRRFVELYKGYGAFLVAELGAVGAGGRGEDAWRRQPLPLVEKAFAQRLWGLALQGEGTRRVYGLAEGWGLRPLD